MLFLEFRSLGLLGPSDPVAPCVFGGFLSCLVALKYFPGRRVVCLRDLLSFGNFGPWEHLLPESLGLLDH